ncbi:MAG TPA: thioesterase family protein [Myxococcaceae bacterium]|jgi:acyl-CoA thioester hydrolase|nr:thioesterase family protein [Myxococcaceae bacterium]
MDYPVKVEFPIHWGEMDAFGHVNNARYFTWFESARIAYFLAIGLPAERRGAVAPILAAAHCDYLKPVVYPARLAVGARATKLGNTSFTLEHEVWPVDAPGQPVARGSSVVVLLDYGTGERVRLPEEVRRAVATLQGAPP